MSNITTLEQAKRLKKLGFREKVRAYYADVSLDYNNPINWNTDDDDYYSAPTIPEALDWIRERKRIICAVDVDYFDGWYYTGKYLDKSKIDFQYTNSFDDHFNAESALLDAVLTYLENKGGE